LLLERDALSAAELVRGLAEEDHGEDVGLLEGRVRGEDQVGLVGRARDVDRDAVDGRPVAGGHVEDGLGGRPAAERDRALLDLEVAPLELEPAVQEADLAGHVRRLAGRSEEHTSELQSLPTISYAVFCLKK